MRNRLIIFTIFLLLAGLGLQPKAARADVVLSPMVGGVKAAVTASPVPTAIPPIPTATDAPGGTMSPGSTAVALTAVGIVFLVVIGGRLLAGKKERG